MAACRGKLLLICTVTCVKGGGLSQASMSDVVINLLALGHVCVCV